MSISWFSPATAYHIARQKVKDVAKRHLSTLVLSADLRPATQFKESLHKLFESLKGPPVWIAISHAFKAQLSISSTPEDKLTLVRNAVALTKLLSTQRPPRATPDAAPQATPSPQPSGDSSSALVTPSADAAETVKPAETDAHDSTPHTTTAPQTAESPQLSAPAADTADPPPVRRVASMPPLADHTEEDDVPSEPVLARSAGSPTEALPLPALADYYDEEDAPNIPLPPKIGDIGRSSRSASTLQFRGSVFMAMPPRDDTRTLFVPKASEPTPSQPSPSPTRTPATDELPRRATQTNMQRPASQMSASYRITTLPRPASSDSVAPMRITPTSAQAPAPSQVSPPSPVSSPATPSSLSARAPAAASNTPPLMSARQAQMECTRSKWVSMKETLKWSECLLVLRGAGDLYVFKEAASPKSLLVMRIDKVCDTAYVLSILRPEQLLTALVAVQCD